MPIDSKIRTIIQQNGNITIDQMMDEVLSLNSSSYYQLQNSLGAEGDFTTASEISQLFGEIIGLWAIDQWQQMGKPKINLVELGPGRGLLMRDLLKVAKLVPEFYNSLTIEFIEINQHFIAQQKSNLAHIALPINHYATIEDIAKKPFILIANEFFDAMPIKQYIKSQELWYESTLVIEPNDSKIKFSKIAINKELQNYLLNMHKNAKDGAVIEESYKSIEIIKFISHHIKQYSGSALIIDYGYDIDPQERTRYQYNYTLQAIKEHKYSPLLESLGEADLSAHVDFWALKTIAGNIGIQINGSISQRDFLMQNGIALRAEILNDNLDSKLAQIINSQVDRLISPTKMGELFKVLTLNKQY